MTPTVLFAAFSILFLSSCNSGTAFSTATQKLLFTNAPGSPVSVPGGPANVLIGDMNNDQKPDLIVACGTARSILILPGKGDGQFGTPLSETKVPDNPSEMATGDLNGDGKLDLAVTFHDSYSVTVLMGDGKGGFAP